MKSIAVDRASKGWPLALHGNGDAAIDMILDACQAVRDAGIAPGDTFAYTGNSRHDLIFSLDKFGGLPHSKFLVTMENIWGRFGNVGLKFWIHWAGYERSLAPRFRSCRRPAYDQLLVRPADLERLIVGAGKLQLAGTADQDIFAGGDGSDQFLHQAFAANPLFPGIMPISAFLVTTAMPQEWGHVAFNIIDPKDRTMEYFDFESLYSQGVILHTEVKVDTNSSASPASITSGRSGNTATCWTCSFRPCRRNTRIRRATRIRRCLRHLPANLMRRYSTTDSTNTWKFLMDLVLIPRGWGLFGRAAIADGGTGNPNFLAWTAQVGFGGDSLLRHRQAKGDRWGIGYNYTATSSEWGPIPTATFRSTGRSSGRNVLPIPLDAFHPNHARCAMGQRCSGRFNQRGRRGYRWHPNEHRPVTFHP